MFVFLKFKILTSDELLLLKFGNLWLSKYRLQSLHNCTRNNIWHLKCKIVVGHYDAEGQYTSPVKFPGNGSNSW